MQALLLSLLWASVSIAQQPSLTPSDPENMLSEAQVRVGRLTGDRVYVRSGPSTNYYPVTRLDHGVEVLIHEFKLGWASISPPPGTYSLIAKEFVDPDGPDHGVVNGDRVWVYAGSALSSQRYAKQVRLAKGAAVRILGAVDDFYKIAPPQGARLWITQDYIAVVEREEGAIRAEELGGATHIPAVDVIAVESPGQASGNAAAPPPPAQPPHGSVAAGESLPASGSPQPERNFDEIIENIELALTEEFKKDLSQRDLQRFIDRFRPIADQEQDATARQYAMHRLEQLNKSLQHVQALREMRQLRQRVQEERRQFQLQRSNLRPPPLDFSREFAARGKLVNSLVYNDPSGPRRYRLVDPQSTSSVPKTIAYVELDPTANLKAEDYLGRYVGVRASDKRVLSGSVDSVVVYTAAEIVILEQLPPENLTASQQ